jgi:hypothetical protein
MPRVPTLNPLANLQSKVSEFVDLVVGHASAEGITPWVRAACNEYPMVNGFLMQPPDQLLDLLTKMFPSLRAKITDRAAAIAKVAEIQERLRRPDFVKR